jgi:hypothetical protein
MVCVSGAGDAVPDLKGCSVLNRSTSPVLDTHSSCVVCCVRSCACLCCVRNCACVCSVCVLCAQLCLCVWVGVGGCGCACVLCPGYLSCVCLRLCACLCALTMHLSVCTLHLAPTKPSFLCLSPLTPPPPPTHTLSCSDGAMLHGYRRGLLLPVLRGGLGQGARAERQRPCPRGPDPRPRPG